MKKIGSVSGKCPRCKRILYRRRPAEMAICDCWEYCPNDHGSGEYATKMDEYKPDLTFDELSILRKCPICGYKSSQLPIEVSLE